MVSQVVARLMTVEIAITHTSTVRSCVEMNISTMTARIDDTIEVTAPATTIANCEATGPLRFACNARPASRVTAAVQITVVMTMRPMSGRASMRGYSVPCGVNRYPAPHWVRR